MFNHNDGWKKTTYFTIIRFKNFELIERPLWKQQLHTKHHTPHASWLLTLFINLGWNRRRLYGWFHNFQWRTVDVIKKKKSQNPYKYTISRHCRVFVKSTSGGGGGVCITFIYSSSQVGNCTNISRYEN